MNWSAVRGVGHAQQGFGQHHQRQALFGGEREFAQHVLDAAEPVVIGPDGLDQARVAVRSIRGSCAALSRRGEQPGRDGAVVGGA